MLPYPFAEYNECRLCPRNCGVDRTTGPTGYCRSGDQPLVASVCLHQGEEPVISGPAGICNVFFAHCNLQCVYCQNFQISRVKTENAFWITNQSQVIEQIIGLLAQGAKAVGFVTPTHFIPHVRSIVNELRRRGLFPVTVYNTNGYERIESLKSLEGLIDVYLPDFKYIDGKTASSFSAASDYPEVVGHALTEMYRQKGSNLIISEEGLAMNGMLIRHLVLPGFGSESIRILEWIAANLSNRLHVSIMSQYYPASCIAEGHPLKRRLHEDEYQLVLAALENLGFENGYIQELESEKHYRPDFSKAHPFG